MKNLSYKKLFLFLVLLFNSFSLEQSLPQNTPPYVNKIVFGYLPYFERNNFDQSNLKNLTHIVDWFVRVTSTGTVVNPNNLPTPGLTDAATLYGVAPILGLNCNDADTDSILLIYPDESIANSVSFMQANDYQGINVDFEAVPTFDKDLFTSFMGDLAVAVHGKH